MSDKLTALPVVTSLADDDLVYAVDISDTTDDPTGSSVGITKNDFLGGGAGTTMTVKKKLQTITNATAGEFDFDNIPAGYDRLIIEGTLRGDIAATEEGVHVYFNADTTDTNYFAQYLYTDNGILVNSEGAFPRILLCSGGNSPAGAHGNVVVRLEDYAGSQIKCAQGESAAMRVVNSMYYGGIGVSHDSMTAAITRIRIRTDNHPTDQLIGTLHLYAEKEVVVGSYGTDAAGTTVQAKVPLAEIDNTSVAGEFDFDNIPAGYDRLVIEGELRSDATVTSDDILLVLNSDTTASNYWRQFSGVANGTGIITDFADNIAGKVSGASSPANAYSSMMLVIEGYAGTHIKKAECQIGSYRASSDAYLGSSLVTATGLTDPTTRIQIRTDNHPTDQLFGKLRLYGEKQIVIAPGKHEIETITNVTAGEFDFNNIPQGYRRLIIEGQLRGDVAATEDNAYLYVNEELTDADYYRQLSAGVNGTNTSSENAQPFIAGVPGGSSTAGLYAAVSIAIEDYAGSNRKVASCDFNAPRSTSDIFMGRLGVLTPTTSAVTRIRVRTNNHATDQLFGTLTLYGEH